MSHPNINPVVRAMNMDDLRILATMPPGYDATLHGIVGDARGEYAERRAVDLLSALPDVAHVRRATYHENTQEATDIVVTRHDDVVIRLQIKSGRAGNGGCRGIKRARKFGAKVVRVLPTLSDAEATERLAKAIGVQVVL